MYFIRFKCDRKESKMEWQWYDNDKSVKNPYPITDQDLIAELEVSYLSYFKIHFDPKEFNKKFNNCLLYQNYVII